MNDIPTVSKVQYSVDHLKSAYVVEFHNLNRQSRKVRVTKDGEVIIDRGMITTGVLKENMDPRGACKIVEKFALGEKIGGRNRT